MVLLKVSAESFPGKAALSFGIDGAKMIKAFCKPRIKVGTEWVTKGQTCKNHKNAACCGHFFLIVFVNL